MKQCTGCKKKKPLSEFYKNKSRPDNRQAKCKECELEIKRKKAKEINIFQII
jgi:hypothetical protein